MDEKAMADRIADAADYLKQQLQDRDRLERRIAEAQDELAGVLGRVDKARNILAEAAAAWKAAELLRRADPGAAYIHAAERAPGPAKSL